MLDDVAVGDPVIRLLGGAIPMPLVVTEVTDELVFCGPWKFRKDTCCEVDEDLGWDGITVTGSILKRDSDEQPT